MRLSDVERDADQAVQHAEETVTGWFHPHHTTEENHMTETTIAPAVDDGTSTAQAPAAPQTFFGLLHHNLATFAAVAGRFLPRLEHIATDPKIDAAVTAILDAADAGVAAEVFDFFTGALHAAVAAKTAAAATDGTGQQPAQQTGAM